MQIQIYTSVIMKASQKVFSDAKTPVFSIFTIIIAAIIFTVYADGIISSVFLQSYSGRLLKVTINDVPLSSVKEIQTDNDGNKDSQSSLIPPFNLTEEERISWFRSNLLEFDILQQNVLSKEFHTRVLRFFDSKCEVQFFMTWISPAESFGKREFLALESVFKVHPRGCVMILSKSLDSTEGHRILTPLLDLKYKAAAVTPDLPFLFKNTPAESWFNEIKSGNKDPGEIPLPQNLSNLIRLAVLYKYGGVYLDTDFIVLRSFSGLRNSIGAQSVDCFSNNWTRLNNAVLVFDRNHPLVLKFIEEFAETFDGNKWGHNGPYLVSRVALKVAGRAGFNFTILPPAAFYPVNWNKVGGFFRKPENQISSRWVNAKLVQLRGGAYGVHLWNKKSSKFRVEEDSVLGRLIAEQCVICRDIDGY